MYQKVILIGNLGQDPDFSQTKSGKAVANMSVATSFGSGENKKTEWHRVQVWDKLAENVSKFLRKGSKVLVEGRLQTRSYDDKDGVKKYVTEIVAHEVKFLDTKGSQGAEGVSGGAEPSDDMPF